MSEENSDSTTSVDRVVLLPCPFCGGKANVECVGEPDANGDPVVFRVECENDCMWRQSISELEASNVWNDRVELHNALKTIGYFVDREIETMDESGQWSTHAINALLCLQSAIDTKLAEVVKSGQ